jgi:hypothetical protein
MHGHAMQIGIRANIAMNAAQQQNSQANYDEASAALDKQNKRGRIAYNTQLWSLLIGALLYAGGHGMHVWENSKQPVAAPSQHSIEKPKIIPAAPKANSQPAAIKPMEEKAPPRTI